VSDEAPTEEQLLDLGIPSDAFAAGDRYWLSEPT
jgi:hypothetical protein